jgi:L-arabinose isomerase
MRVLRIGEPFQGMGDFQVRPETLEAKLGVRVETADLNRLAGVAAGIADAEIEAENARDRARYQVDAPEEVLTRSNRVGLAVRRLMEQGGCGALSRTFMAFDRAEGPVCAVPFLECGKAMERGQGYAGEGDVLTAAFVGALGAGIGPLGFTEMFCPDWRGGSIFLSHMGEFNPAIAAGRARVYEKPFPFTPAQNPAAFACAPVFGEALLLNLAPGPDDSFRLIAAPVTALEDGTHPDIANWVRGWIRPNVPLTQFLEEYSELGGTHHGALMPEGDLETIALFARHCGIEMRVIGA